MGYWIQTSQPVGIAHREILTTRREIATPLTSAHAHDSAYAVWPPINNQIYGTAYYCPSLTPECTTAKLWKAHTRDYYCQKQCCLLKIRLTCISTRIGLRYTVRNHYPVVRPWETPWNRESHGQIVRVERSVDGHSARAHLWLIARSIYKTVGM